MSFNYTIMQPGTALILSGSTLDNMFSIVPTYKKFVFQPGDYYLNDNLVIDKPNVTFSSYNNNPFEVNIYQNNPSKDSFVLRYANYCRLRGISIHNTHPGKVALTVASCNRTHISNCKFYGNETTFSIYYAGPSALVAGADTLNAYNSSLLDSYNTFTKNIVYSYWAGDSVSLSLQKNSTFTNNIVRGGKLAVYMCKDTVVERNTIYDSIGSGIHVSFPCHNLTISKNYIYKCADSGIRLTNQLEHGSFTTTNYNIVIDSNSIWDAGYFAIEINDGLSITIQKNSIWGTDIFGCYLLRCNDIIFTENNCTYFTVGVWMENTNQCQITYNTFNSVYPSESENIVRIVASNFNTINNNTIFGKVIGDLYPEMAGSINNTFIYNIHNTSYTYDQELAITKIK